MKLKRKSAGYYTTADGKFVIFHIFSKRWVVVYADDWYSDTWYPVVAPQARLRDSRSLLGLFIEHNYTEDLT